jgi:hypothetical protein
MNIISLPRDALAELLKSAGSPLTPEQYIASLSTVNIVSQYAGRAKASMWSKKILAVAAVLSLVWLPFNFDLEDVILTVGICAVTFFEYRVNRYFREGHPNGPSLGFRNQSLFAVGILIYGLYHALFPSKMQLPEEYRDLVDASTLALMQSTTRVGYLVIGIAGGLSQFALAWYYRGAQVKANAPPL